MLAQGASTIIAIDVGSVDDTSPRQFGESLSGWWVSNQSLESLEHCGKDTDNDRNSEQAYLVSAVWSCSSRALMSSLVGTASRP